ncbi:MAG: TetR/AcrR family transcriptional regulator [Cyanobacteria bacterium P01_D01_bin.36]
MTTKKIQKRGRPRGFDLSNAIAVAIDLFHRKGYDGVGVAELSKSIGITAPSLYSAFGNKRSLFEEALKRYVQENGCRLSAVLASEGALDAVITHLFVRAAEVYTDDAEHCGCLVMDATRNCGDDGAKALTERFQQVTRQLICDRIIEGEPALSVAKAALLADYAMTILVGLSGRARDGQSRASLVESANIAAAGFSQRLQQYREEKAESDSCD